MITNQQNPINLAVLLVIRSKGVLFKQFSNIEHHSVQLNSLIQFLKFFPFFSSISFIPISFCLFWRQSKNYFNLWLFD